ncbi:hypothetical protein HK097_005865 [Rhizophlyctis rosea]|uniref:Uncharacterized protein n=1 Tax=Rhizophlyctis rosea TaxID=64517 RepID=A0AAD5WZB4_9FUNG|nr:hypothetical protein HK097_005865 [Rhizophlyctis rosea]
MGGDMEGSLSRAPLTEEPSEQPGQSLDVDILSQPLGTLSGWDTIAPTDSTSKDPETVYIPAMTDPSSTIALDPSASQHRLPDSSSTSQQPSKPPPAPYKPRRPTPPKRVSTNLALLSKTSTQPTSETSSSLLSDIPTTITPPSDSLDSNQKDGEGGDLATGLLHSSVAGMTNRMPLSKFAGRKGSIAGGGSVVADEETEKQKRRAEAVDRARLQMLGKGGQAIDLTRLRKQRMAEGGAHRSGLEGDKAKEDFLSALVKDMNVLDENSKARYLALSEPLFRDKEVLSMQEMADGLRRMGRDVKEEEVEFIKKVRFFFDGERGEG